MGEREYFANSVEQNVSKIKGWAYFTAGGATVLAIINEFIRKVDKVILYCLIVAAIAPSLQDLLARVRRAKWGEKELDFDARLKQAESEIKFTKAAAVEAGEIAGRQRDFSPAPDIQPSSARSAGARWKSSTGTDCVGGLHRRRCGR